MKPVIVVVGYNRPKSLGRLLDSIENAIYKENNIKLIISLDKASNEKDVLEVANSFIWTHGDKEIRIFKERQGLRKHILSCGDLTNIYEAVIILEDDLIVSQNFYEYTKKALEYYQDKNCITGIALYSHEWNGYARRNFVPIADQYDTYLGQYSITWGQCWTKKWWNNFKEWYNKHEDKLEYNPNIPSNINRWSDKSWGKYFVNYIVEKNKYYVIPRISYSTNCSDVGEHVKISENVHQVRLMNGAVENYVFAPIEKAQKYDIFFESKKLKSKFKEEIQKEGVIIDLFGIGRNVGKSRYILTTLELPYTIVESYGLQLRPYEMNIINNIPGNEIFLYDTLKEDKVKKNCNIFNVMRYEVRGFSIKDLLPYVFELFKQSIKYKIRKKR